jgi:hypothetical protein
MRKALSKALYPTTLVVNSNVPKIFGGYSGTIVEVFGYSEFFILTTLIGLPILYLVYKVKPYID